MRAISRVEGHAVVGARVVARLELGLGHRGLERHVPQPGGLGLVGLVASKVAQERLLRRRARVVIDRAVGDVPVEGLPETTEERLERLLVLDGQLVAQLDEVLARDRHGVAGAQALGVAAVRRLERGVVGERGVTAHAVEVLDPLLGRQAVVVPADRVEDVEAGHPLVARHAVGVRVRKDVAHVQAARRGRRGSVDREDLRPVAGQRGVTVEGVGLLLGPYLSPLVLEAVQRGALRNDGSARWREVSRHGRDSPRTSPVLPTGFLCGVCRPPAPATGAPCERRRRQGQACVDLRSIRAMARPRSRSWWTGSEAFILVDDYDLVVTSAGSPLRPLIPLLAQAADVGLHLVVTRRAGGASRASYEPVLQAMRDLASPGIMLSTPPDEGALVGNLKGSLQPPGRGRLVTRDQGNQVVQLAWLPAQHS